MQAATRFIVLGFTPQIDGTPTILTIVHYRENTRNKLEIAVQSMTIGQNKRNDFLDFETEIKQIDKDNYPKSERDIDNAFERIDMCLKHPADSVISNEKAINYILTGDEGDNQYNFKKDDSCKWMSEIKMTIQNVGHKTAILLAVVPAVIGGLFWHPYVRVIVAAMVSYSANVKDEGNCKNKISENVISEAKRIVDEVIEYEIIRKIHNMTNVNTLINSALHSNIVCQVAESMAKDILEKICIVSGGFWACLETVFLVLYLYNSVLPKMQSSITLQNKYKKQFFVRFVAGYLSGIIAICAGGFGQRYGRTPSIYFFGFAFLFGFFSRYCITICLGLLYLCCTSDDIPKRKISFISNCESKPCYTVWIVSIIALFGVAVVCLITKRVNITLRPYL